MTLGGCVLVSKINNNKSTDDAYAEAAEYRGRIAFVLYGYGLGNSPSLINAAKMFATTGYCVDFFTCGTFLGDISFDDPKIQIHEIAKPGEWRSTSNIVSRILRFASIKIRGLKHLLSWSLQVRSEEKSITKAVLYYVDSLVTIINQTKYKCLFGVEPAGLMAACLLASKYEIPVVYYNMELHFSPDISTANEFVAKNIEKKFNKFTLFTITQDRERARMLSEENSISEDSIVTVPVCADGEPFMEKTSYLRERLGLGEDARIILYAGFIVDWAMCEELAISAQSWPNNWVLVLHSHGYFDGRYMEKIKKYEGERVHFSSTPVPYEELPALLASADIGIALYRDLGKNFTLISSASGKLAHYLKSGLPVIVNSYRGVAQVVAKYVCGISVDNPSEIKDAVKNIFDNYEKMRSGAYLCYEENYRFSRHFIKVVQKIDHL